MTADELKTYRAFLKTWTKNGKVPVNRIADTNFFIPGTNRKRGTKITPEELCALVAAGVLQPRPGFYLFVPEGR
jgi:hypothetical protein